jgi:hypothetical protein
LRRVSAKVALRLPWLLAARQNQPQTAGGKELFDCNAFVLLCVSHAS